MFRTWVRLPSSPLKEMLGITMFRAFFFIIELSKKNNINKADSKNENFLKKMKKSVDNI